MKQLENINPNELDDDSRCIFQFTEYVESIEREQFFYLLLDDGFLIWARKGVRQLGNELLVTQR